MRRVAAAAVVLAAIGWACSDPDIPDGAFECGEVDPRCPPDFLCGDDARCHLDQVEGEGGAGGSGGEGGSDGVCDDGACDPPSGEDCISCPSDCGPCAATCGDAVCVDESCVDCPRDCGVCPPNCGDRICDADETPRTCPADC